MQSKEDLYPEHYLKIQEAITDYIMTNLKSLYLVPRIGGNVSLNIIEKLPDEVFQLRDEEFAVWISDIENNIGHEKIKEAMFTAIIKRVHNEGVIRKESRKFPENYREDLTKAGYEYLKELIRTEVLKSNNDMIDRVKKHMDEKYKELIEKEQTSWAGLVSNNKEKESIQKM